MPRVRITSWNTQGDAINKISQNHSKILPAKTDGLYREDINNIILLQEAGSTYGYNTPLNGEILQTFGRTNYKGFFSQHETADNKRCTTGIMASEGAVRSYYMKIYDINPAAVKRPVVISVAQFKYFSLYIATVHATADHHVSRKEIDSIIDILKRCAGNINWQFLLMGDFNITPDELSRSEGIPLQNIIKTGKTTQLSGNELDFAIASDGLAPNLTLNLGGNYGSDHWSIYTEFDSDMPL